jgi:hypothetical protein
MMSRTGMVDDMIELERDRTARIHLAHMRQFRIGRRGRAIRKVIKIAGHVTNEVIWTLEDQREFGHVSRFRSSTSFLHDSQQR